MRAARAGSSCCDSWWLPAKTSSQVLGRQALIGQLVYSGAGMMCASVRCSFLPDGVVKHAAWSAACCRASGHLRRSSAHCSPLGTRDKRQSTCCGREAKLTSMRSFTALLSLLFDSHLSWCCTVVASSLAPISNVRTLLTQLHTCMHAQFA